MSNTEKNDGAAIQITKNGPYLVTGRVPLLKQFIVCNPRGESIRWQEGSRYPLQDTYTLCRCGGSCNKPYCDGTHVKSNFDGTETASRVPYLTRADWFEGCDVRLSDAPGFCSHARFCVKGRGIWDLVETQRDSDTIKKAADEVAKCPSGRLILWDKTTGKPIEPVFEKSIGVVEGPEKDHFGPLWIRGGIPITSADGFLYEVRNRVTLCLCGNSRNKPFCDGSHMGKR